MRCCDWVQTTEIRFSAFCRTQLPYNRDGRATVGPVSNLRDWDGSLQQVVDVRFATLGKTMAVI